jgi:hypothetical protein
MPIYAFQIDVQGTKTVYRVDSLRIRELWVTALTSFIMTRSVSPSESKENKGSPVYLSRPSASFVLSEIRGLSNSASITKSRPVLNATAKLLLSDDCPEGRMDTLPKKLEETVNAKRRRIIDLQNKIESAADIGDLIADFKKAKLLKQLDDLRAKKAQFARDIVTMERENAAASAQVREFE